jgi:2-polyprenyl-3-methyl-5-hydroxy-6-metoxy-1,4-benzoquinol methylase
MSATEKHTQRMERSQHWSEYADKQVENIDGIYKTSPTCHLVRDAMVKAVGMHVPAGKRVVDIGCGTGEIAIALHDAGYEVTGLDISAAMIEKFNINKQDRDIPIIKGDIFALEPDHMFDVATARYVFSHYDDFALLLTHIAAHVEPGGLIIFDSFSTDAVRRSSAAAGLSRKSFGRKVYSKLSHFGQAELELTCAQNGLKIESRYPGAFFHRNPLLVSSYTAMKEYDHELEQHLRDPGVQNFMRWFHDKIAPSLDSSISGQIVNVIRKI